MVPGLQHERFAGFDGTELAYQVRGRGPAVVLVNGLGGNFEVFRPVYDELGEDYRVVCWDYRGLFGSRAPRDASTLSVPRQCDDLELLLDRLRIDRAVFVGWSMGVQMIFEFHRRRRRRVDGIVAISGAAGRPFRSALASRALGSVIPLLLRVGRTRADLVGRATRRWIAWRRSIAVMQRVGMVSRAVDVAEFRGIAEAYANMDWTQYMATLSRLGDHDASDVLADVTAPTLIIAGDRDLLTPPSTAEAIHRAIRGSRLVMIPGGTHYTPVEYPDVIREQLAGFLAALPDYAAPLRSRAAGT